MKSTTPIWWWSGWRRWILGKAGLEACVRVPHPQRPGRRMQELRGYATTTAQLLAMAPQLWCSGFNGPLGCHTVSNYPGNLCRVPHSRSVGRRSKGESGREL